MKKQLVQFIKDTYSQTGKNKAVIAVSGGLDSAVVLTLLVEAMGQDNVFPILLPYMDQDMTDAELIINKLNIPKENISTVNIGEAVEQLQQALAVGSEDKFRLGNIMARVRMIAVYDLAKSLAALVCGTENKSEHYLGYYTMHGDGAADLEPIIGLYKTKVRKLAKELDLPQQFLDKEPSAGLWIDQTDEEELGFSYQDADGVMRQIVDEGKSADQVTGVDKAVVKQVVEQMEKTEYKRQVPYTHEE